MDYIDEAEDLTRMPGLFRKWEFPEVLKTRRTYRLEEGGSHADGTPLVAIYTDTPEPDDAEQTVLRVPDAKTGGG